jgi:hypothetical protein
MAARNNGMKAPLLLLASLFSLASMAACNGHLDVGSTQPSGQDISNKPVGGTSSSSSSGASGTVVDAGSVGPGISTGPATYSIAGTINGASFKPASAIAFRGNWVGGTDYPADEYLRVFFSDHDELNCDAYPSLRNSVMLRLEIKQADAHPTPTPLTATNHVLLDVSDATCDTAPTAPTSGSVFLKTVEGSVIGTVDATFSNGSLSGDFAISVCANEPSAEPLCN